MVAVDRKFAAVVDDAPLAGRHFILLQGPSSRFFLHVGKALRRRGAKVTRIAFSPADHLYWSRSAGSLLPYRGKAEDFGSWLNETLRHVGATDLIMLGDGRGFHRAALETVAANSAVTPWIVELGYLRPGLLTFYDARTGPVQSGTLPPEPPQSRIPSWFPREAAQDVLYHAANSIAPIAGYRHYRPHALDGPAREYSGWVLKALRLPARRMAARTALTRIMAHDGPTFLIPLQLDTDFQLRLRGTGNPQQDDLLATMQSFKEHAPKDSLLVVKEHPMDNGLRRYVDVTADCARKAGIADRCVFLDGGTVEALFPRISGVVTINSTVGLSALIEGVPVKVLGKAIYDRDGLTYQGPLDDFWLEGTPPDKELATLFQRNLRHFSHVPGSFDGPGALVGADNIARRLAGERPA